MYNQWLYFFNSPEIEISIKNKKEKQEINKEWLDNGNMKISGSKPSDWYIVLQPNKYDNIYNSEYEINNNKLESLYLMKKGFQTQNKKIFEDGEKMYEEFIKKNENIKNTFVNNLKKKTDIKEKIFEVKKNIYIQTLNKKSIKELNTKLETLLIEDVNINKEIKHQEHNYLIQSQSILSNGPFPEAPIIKPFKIQRETLTSKEQKYNELIKKKIEQIENPKGGFIKVIKLS